MSHRKQLATVIENIIFSEELDPKNVEESTINDYKSLNEKCDTIISKIKKRKEQPPTKKK